MNPRVFAGLLLVAALSGCPHPAPVVRDHTTPPPDPVTPKSSLTLPKDLVAVDVEASSSRKGEATETLAPWRVVDRDKAATGWCEDKADAGVGETITIRFGKRVAIERVIVASDLPAPSAKFTRPARFTISTDDGRAIGTSEYPDGGWIAHVGAPPVASLVVAIAAVQPKDGATITCVSDVELSGPQGAVLRPLVGVTATALDALPAGLEAIAAAFTSCESSALARTAAFPLHYRRGVEEGDYRDVDALVADCKAGTAPKLATTAQAALDAVAQEQPGEVIVPASDDRRWHLAFEGGAWRLVSTSHSE